MGTHTRTCIHHWFLGEPAHGRIQGTCRRCGAMRTYPSGLEPIEDEEAVPQFVVEDFDASFAEAPAEVAAAKGHALV